MPSAPEGLLVSQAELSRIFSVAPQTILAWERRGCPVEAQGKRGKAKSYRTSDVIQWREEQAKLAASGDLDAMNVDEARRRKLAAEAATAELALARMKDEVVDVAMVAQVIGAGLAACRARLLQIGAKVAPLAEIAPNATAIKEIVDDAIYEALDEISGDALAFGAEAGGDPDEGMGEADFGDDGAATQADPERMG